MKLKYSALRFGSRRLVAVTVLATLGAVGCSSDNGPSSSVTEGAGNDAGSGSGSGDGGGGDASVAPSADWTMLGYDVGSTYFNTAEKKMSRDSAPQLDKAWEFDMGANASSVTGTPVIVGDTVYLASAGAYALKLDTGEQIWANQDVGATSSMAYDDGTLYLHDGTGVLHALSAEDGHELWSFKTDDQANLVGFSSPVVTEDYIIIGGSTLEEVSVPEAAFRGFVEAVKKDGTLGWKKYTVDEGAFGATLWSSVSVDPVEGIVFAATGNNHGPPATDTSDAFLAIPLADGSDFLWKKQIFEGDVWMQRGSGASSPDNDFGANPIVFDLDGKKLVAGGNKGGDFWVLDRTSGDILQKRNLCNPSGGNAFKGGVFVNGAWDGERLLAACNKLTGATLFGLDPSTLDIVWQRDVTGPVFGPISVANGVGFVGDNMTLQAFNTETGDVLKKFETEATIASAPAVSNGYVVFGSGMAWIQSTGGSKYYALKVP